MRPDRQLLVEMHRKMLLIRCFETRANELFQQQRIMGPLHLYIGEEAVAVGACSAIRDDDYITSTHRGHGHCIAKGGDPRRMMAELMGKIDGYCKGKGGSMHIAAFEKGILGANGIVGGGIPIAVGSALGNQMMDSGRVTLCFFGDGASNTGAFHEGLNLAGAWRLPVVFICENNLYAISVSTRQSLPIPDVAARAASYGFPGRVVDGNDVIAVYEQTLAAVQDARAGKGPTLIECKTYRWMGHYVGDKGTYRSQEEIDEWKLKDPIARLEDYLIGEGILDQPQIDSARQSVEKEIEAAQVFAENSPFPGPEWLERDVLYAG